MFLLPDGSSASWLGTWRDRGCPPPSSWAGCAARCAPTSSRPPTRSRAAHAGPQDPVLRAGRDGHRAVRPLHPGDRRVRFSSAGHLPPVLAAPGHPAGMLPVRPDPPIGAGDDPERRSATAVIPPGSLLCCFTDGLVERRDEAIDPGIGRVAAALDQLIATGPGPAGPYRRQKPQAPGHARPRGKRPGTRRHRLAYPPPAARRRERSVSAAGLTPYPGPGNVRGSGFKSLAAHPEVFTFQWGLSSRLGLTFGPRGSR